MVKHLDKHVPDKIIRDVSRTHPGFPSEVMGNDEVSKRENLSKLKDVLPESFRTRITHVALLCGESREGLSWPIMFSAMLAQHLPRNFPNARFMDYSGLMSLVKLPENGSLRSMQSQSPTHADFQGDPEKSVSFCPARHPSTQLNDLLRDVSSTSFILPVFGMSHGGDIRMLRHGGDDVKAALEEPEDNIQSIHDMQSEALTLLGLEGLPGKGVPNRLSESDYSPALRHAISQQTELFKRCVSSLPVLLINTTKRDSGEESRNQK
jgi:hypothetical protein